MHSPSILKVIGSLMPFQSSSVLLRMTSLVTMQAPRLVEVPFPNAMQLHQHVLTAALQVCMNAACSKYSALHLCGITSGTAGPTSSQAGRRLQRGSLQGEPLPAQHAALEEQSKAGAVSLQALREVPICRVVSQHEDCLHVVPGPQACLGFRNPIKAQAQLLSGFGAYQHHGLTGNQGRPLSGIGRLCTTATTQKHCWVSVQCLLDTAEEMGHLITCLTAASPGS